MYFCRLLNFMDEITIHDKVFIPYITYEEIEHAIKRMANTIYEEHKNDVPVFIGVLNGVVMFMSDFLKQYPGECEISFLKIASYEGMETTGEVHLQMDRSEERRVGEESICNGRAQSCEENR